MGYERKSKDRKTLDRATTNTNLFYKLWMIKASENAYELHRCDCNFIIKLALLGTVDTWLIPFADK